MLRGTGLILGLVLYPAALQLYHGLYEYIFVDEYQDIDEQQYALVSALAGRRRTESDSKLSVMAVGDDDQNIYTFKGASVELIRRFRAPDSNIRKDKRQPTRKPENDWCSRADHGRRYNASQGLCTGRNVRPAGRRFAAWIYG